MVVRWMDVDIVRGRTRERIDMPSSIGREIL